MKKFFLALSFLLILLAVVYIGLFTVVNTMGKSMLSERIEEEFGSKPKIGSLSLRFPFTVRIEDFVLEDLAFAQAEFSVRGFNPFTSTLRLHKVYLDRLDLRIVRAKDEIAINPLYPREFSSQNFSLKEKNIEKPINSNKPDLEAVGRDEEFNLKVKKLYISNSKVRYLDKDKDAAVELVLAGIDTQVKNIYYPKLTEFSFDFIASLEAGGVVLKDLITANGWVDYYNKNMDVDLKVSLLEYSVLSDYYLPAWRARNLGIDKAYLSLKSNLKAKDNDLVIDAQVVLDKIDFMDVSSENKERISRQKLIRTVTNLLKDETGKSAIRFKLKTKMDSPQLSAESILESMRKSLPIDYRVFTGQIIDRGIGLIRGGTGQAIGVPRETIDRAVETLRGTLDTLKDIFTDPE